MSARFPFVASAHSPNAMQSIAEPMQREAPSRPEEATSSGTSNRAAAPIQFCLARFDLPHDVVQSNSGDNPLFRELLGYKSPRIAIEVIRESDGQMAVLVAVFNEDNRARLRCILGYSNSPAWCDQARGQGFPMSEAHIELSTDGTLTLQAPRFMQVADGGPAVLEIGKIFSLKGVRLDIPPDDHPSDSKPPQYEQDLLAPDTVQPASFLLSVPRKSTAIRRSVDAKASVDLCCEAARYPNLADVLGNHSQSHSVICGEFVTPAAEPSNISKTAGATAVSPLPRPIRIRRSTVFGPPAFNFEGVEIVGFRLDLNPYSKASAGLKELISPLNFHLKKDRLLGCADDFEFRTASHTVIVELLRYDQMRSTTPMPPLRPQDYMSQHELLVRVLVGKVDDDTAQARDAATFVPAIFVDNAWSKAVGRELQGFAKELAWFSASGGDKPSALRMDGRRQAGGDRVPLVEVNKVSLVRTLGDTPERAGTANRLLTLSYSTAGFDDRFERIDLASLLGTGLLASSPWRQSDFDAGEFRRSFAREALFTGFDRFGTVQVSPMDTEALPQAWITGNFKLKNFEVQFPVGIANLELFHESVAKAGDNLPRHPWSQLCRLLGARGRESVKIDLPTGSWYRARCAMDLTIDDGLDW